MSLASQIEGWHTRLKKMVGKAHPNNFEVFEVMKKEQASSDMKLEQLELGGARGMLLENVEN